jgi:hypothetical protein
MTLTNKHRYVYANYQEKWHHIMLTLLRYLFELNFHSWTFTLTSRNFLLLLLCCETYCKPECLMKPLFNWYSASPLNMHWSTILLCTWQRSSLTLFTFQHGMYLSEYSPAVCLHLWWLGFDRLPMRLCFDRVHVTLHPCMNRAQYDR